MDSRPWWILLLLVRRRSTWSPPKATTRKTTSTIRRNTAVVLVLLHWAGGNAGMFRIVFTDPRFDFVFFSPDHGSSSLSLSCSSNDLVMVGSGGSLHRQTRCFLRLCCVAFLGFRGFKIKSP